MRAAYLSRVMSLWPPFLGAGIRVVELSDDYTRARVRLRRHTWNRNLVGTQFGGSLYAMCDPLWMVMLFRHLGDDHIVWDKAGEIEFVTPGRSDVFATFELTQEQIEAIRAEAAENGKSLTWFSTDVTMADGTVVARVRKLVYVRRKPDRAPSQSDVTTAEA